MADDDPDKVHAALEWMLREKSRGYKAAGREFGVSPDAVKRLNKTNRQRASRARARQAAASEEDPPPAAPPVPIAAPAQGPTGRPRNVEPGTAWSPALRVLAKPNPAKVVEELAGDARRALRGFERGGRVVGLTAGQFSMLDLIRAVVEHTGPANVTLSTWTIGLDDTETAAWLVASQAIRSLRLMTDHSFASRQPAYAKRLVELFGPGCVTLTHTHAKFATVRNNEWNVCIRSSMNLNRNRRWEQFDVDDDLEICAVFDRFVERVGEQTGAGALGVPSSQVEEGFSAIVERAQQIKRQEERRLRQQADALEHADPVTFWRNRVAHCVQMAMDCEADGDMSNALKFESQLRYARQALDKARAESAAEEELRRASEVRDPTELARMLLPELPHLARLLPDQGREVWRTLGTALGEMDDGEEYTPPDEQQRSLRGDREGYKGEVNPSSE